MKRPVYYLWKNAYTSEESYQAVRDLYIQCGFRVVTFVDGSPDKDINDGLKALIKNHWND